MSADLNSSSNAIPDCMQAKQAADMVTQAVDDDGLASAFYKLGVI